MKLSNNYLELVEELIELAQEHANTPLDPKVSTTIDRQKSNLKTLSKQTSPMTKSIDQSQCELADHKTTKLSPSQKAFIFSEIFNRKY